MFRRSEEHLRRRHEFGQWMYFSNGLLIESCALSAMDRDPQTLDEAM